MYLPSFLARVFAAATLLLLGPVLWNDAGAQDNGRAPLPETWALQFAIAPDFDLASFSGSTLSIKRQFSSTQSLRVGVSVQGRFEDREDETSRRSEERDLQSYSVEGIYVSHVAGSNDIHAYVGIGPFVSFSSNEESSDLQNERTDEDLFGVGAIGVLGVEWLLRSNLSVTAEYSADVSYEQITLDRSGGESIAVDRDVDRWSFGGRGATLGVSVYF